MKSVCLCALLLLGSAGLAQGQVETAKPVFDTDNAAPDFSATSAAKATLPDVLAMADSFSRTSMTSVTRLSTALSAQPASADPASPSPNPRFVYGGRNDYRWQLGLSLAWVRFNSSRFNANAIGIETSVAYFLNEWLGVEGDVTAVFSPTTIGNNHVKLLIYGGGPKVAAPEPLGAMATRDFWRSTRAAPVRRPKPQFILHHGGRRRGLPLEPSPLVPRRGRLRAYRLLWSIAKQFQASRRRRPSFLTADIFNFCHS